MQYQIYTAGKLIFILTPDKVVVRTGIGQQFYLQPKQHYWSRRLKLIRVMIELGEVRDLNELSGWCAGGNIMWLSTNSKYKLDNLELEAYN